jgi:putative FmdB family regulatory protein
MPIYGYRCANGHLFEVFQSMTDDPVASCEECGAPVERVFHPVAVHFKGSGFYTTDYARKGAGKSSDGGSDSAKDAKKESKGGSGDKAKGDSGDKAAKASTSSSDSSD